MVKASYSRLVWMMTMRAYTMTSSSPKPGDVWFTYHRFIDKPDIGKVRPIVVVDVDGDEVLALKITSKSPDLIAGI